MRLYQAFRVACAAWIVVACTRHAEAPGVAAVGERIFNGSCVSCHQQNGLGIPGAYPSLAGSPLVLGDIEPLAAWVIEGRRPVQWPEGRYSTVMPKFGWITDENAAALFTYLRTHFGNSAAAVDAAAVARALGR